MGVAESRGVEPGPASPAMKAAFGAALREAMGARSAVSLAKAVGLTPDAIAKWQRGDSEPPPLTVFAAERFLEVAPGDLSRHLGYLPASSPASVPAAIDADPRLSAEVKRVLLATYRAGRRG